MLSKSAGEKASTTIPTKQQKIITINISSNSTPGSARTGVSNAPNTPRKIQNKSDHNNAITKNPSDPSNVFSLPKVVYLREPKRLPMYGAIPSPHPTTAIMRNPA